VPVNVRGLANGGIFATGPNAEHVQRNKANEPNKRPKENFLGIISLPIDINSTNLLGRGLCREAAPIQ
jgi:hypothetical protein